MAHNWDRYSRQGLDIAHTATSLGFSAVKVGTRFGFSVARGIATTAVGAASFAVDQTLFGGSTVARPILAGSVAAVLSLAEQITLAPIHLSEYITNTSLLAAHSTINALSVIFPGSSEASFSLVSFIDLVKREWRTPTGRSDLPERHYGITQVAWAIVGWVSLQGVTQEWQEKGWFRHLKEVDVGDAPKSHDHERRHRKHSRIRVTSDVIFPGERGPQIITADIGDVPSQTERIQLTLRKSKSRPYLKTQFSSTSLSSTIESVPEDQVSITELKATLRRLSKMVLAGYGGASLLFFGVPPHQQNVTKPSAPSPSGRAESPSTAIQREKSEEETNLANAIDASEAEAAGNLTDDSVPPPDADIFQQYSWWDILLGKHDQEIFERSLAHTDDQSDKTPINKLKSKMKSRAVIGNEHLMPRFWVLTDYSREQIVLVIRGTMSLNEIAADLTCEPEWFQPAQTPQRTEHDEHPIPGQFAFPSNRKSAGKRSSGTQYQVHGGMLRLAKLMGDVGNPVQLAVMEALHCNPEFELVLCGHSLGAGVAALLGLIWADPDTCLTVPSSGLPVGRRVYVYCFAPPALTDPALGRLASGMIVSFVYSHDVVSRLSLGSVRDIRNAAMWLCEANEGQDGKKKGEGYTAVAERARQWKSGKGSLNDMQWLIAMRKTLEANMRNSDMFPPGRVLWAVRDDDLHPSYRRYQASKEISKDKLRLFEVLDTERVFSQLVFAQNMLTSHMPHQYDKALHELL